MLNNGGIMRHIEYTPELVCSKLIAFDLDEENKIHNLQFVGGCHGNLKAIGLLCENKDAKEIAELLSGNTCRMLPTSCADQLAKALLKSLSEYAN